MLTSKRFVPRRKLSVFVRWSLPGLMVLGLGLAMLPARTARGGSSLAVGVAREPGTLQQDVCASCHVTEYADWQNSRHADPSLVPERHEDWGGGPMPDYCRFCHPQGIDTAAGQIVTTGVTCVSCHGAYSDDHPPAVMPIRRTTELCGSCHSATYHEWRSSGHGQQGIACVSCHSVHSQTTRGEQGQFLCLTCHAERFHDFLSTAHGTAGLTCIRCHLGNRPHDVQGVRTSSRVSPSHTFVARIEICLECHRDSIHNIRALLTPAAQAIGQPGEGTPTVATGTPSSPAASSPPTPAGTLDVTWVSGAVAGLLLGLAVAWVTLRARSA